MDAKLVFSLIATVVGVASFAGYIREIILGTTRPHVYTWLIWLITQGTATAGLWYGGGGIGALELTVGTSLVFVVLILSFWRGTKNISRSDSVILCASLCALLAWSVLGSPLIAVTMVSVIDVIGYIPSIRKSYYEPWSENVLSWAGFILSNAFAVAALEAYNPLTLSYLVAISFANLVIIAVCLARRQGIQRPQVVT